VGLEYAKDLDSLSYLSLEGTQITDSGLEHLKGMTNLRILELKGTRVTDAGVAELEKALPDLMVLRGRNAGTNAN
jgi:Leucine-rich repeat (LRR) protein